MNEYEATIKRLQDYMKQANKSQTKVARELGISQSAISQWITGRKTMCLKIYLKINNYLREVENNA